MASFYVYRQPFKQRKNSNQFGLILDLRVTPNFLNQISALRSQKGWEPVIQRVFFTLLECANSDRLAPPEMMALYVMFLLR